MTPRWLVQRLVRLPHGDTWREAARCSASSAEAAIALVRRYNPQWDTVTLRAVRTLPPRPAASEEER